MEALLNTYVFFYFSGYDEATSRCQEEDYSLLDHLTSASTKFVTSKVDQDRTGSKSQMIWLGAQRQRTSNFRGEEWRWISDNVILDIEFQKPGPRVQLHPSICRNA